MFPIGVMGPLWQEAEGLPPAGQGKFWAEQLLKSRNGPQTMAVLKTAVAAAASDPEAAAAFVAALGPDAQLPEHFRSFTSEVAIRALGMYNLDPVARITVTNWALARLVDRQEQHLAVQYGLQELQPEQLKELRLALEELEANDTSGNPGAQSLLLSMLQPIEAAQGQQAAATPQIRTGGVPTPRPGPQGAGRVGPKSSIPNVGR